MPKLLVFFFTLFSLNLYAQSYQSLPDNDLWLQDNLFKGSNVSEEMFNQIISIGEEIYRPLADAQGEKLVINRRWTDATVNANCSRWFGTVTVNMYGGLARREEVTPEGFALVMCHELGHAYGGYPFVSSWNQLSAEGQSDYYGAKVCHWQVMERLGLAEYGPTSPFIESTCANVTPEKEESCLRGLIAGQSLGNLLATIKKVPYPDYEKPDKTEVSQTQLSYPATVQCRLDTYYNGVMSIDRPRCWFKN